MCYSHELTIALEVVDHMTDSAGRLSLAWWRGMLASGYQRLNEFSSLGTLLDLTDIEVVS